MCNARLCQDFYSVKVSPTFGFFHMWLYNSLSTSTASNTHTHTHNYFSVLDLNSTSIFLITLAQNQISFSERDSRAVSNPDQMDQYQVNFTYNSTCTL